MERRANEQYSVIENHECCKKRGPVIGLFPSGASPERDGDADERGGRRDRVACMVPGICGRGSAVSLGADRSGPSKHSVLHDQHADEDKKRPWSRCLMWSANLPYGLDPDSDSSSKKHHRHDDRCYRFGLAVTERVVVIRVAAGDTKPAPY